MSANGPHQTRRILVIDDNAAIHEDYRKILSGPQGTNEEIDKMNALLFGVAANSSALTFELHSAYQGAEGLNLVKEALANKRPYAMAFIDIKMPPGWDGVETTARIWEICPDLPVVLCTAYSDYSWNEVVTRLGRTDKLVILKKPFDYMEVLQLAHALTKKWNLIQHGKRGGADFKTMRTAELQTINQVLQDEMEDRQKTKKKST